MSPYVFFYLRCECGQALAKPPLRWWKSLSLNMLSLKKASSRKNTWDTWANEEAPSGFEGGSSCSRVRVSPPRVRRSKASGFSCSAWPLRPARKRKTVGLELVVTCRRQKRVDFRHKHCSDFYLWSGCLAGADSTDSPLQETSCSSCPARENDVNLWVPALCLLFSVSTERKSETQFNNSFFYL